METLVHVLTGVAIMANAVIYGTDVFCAIVQRPALAEVDDAALTSVMGQVHRFGDRRLPIPGVTGLVAAALAAVLAGVAGHPLAAVGAAVATVSLIVWLVIYDKVSAPINKQLTAAAQAGSTPANARALQNTWDTVITARAALQTIALATLYLPLTT